jgi:hypothetical protein
VERPVGADPDPDLGRSSGEFESQADGIVAAVEYEQRGLEAKFGTPSQQAVDLEGGGRAGIFCPGTSRWASTGAVHEFVVSSRPTSQE